MNQAGPLIDRVQDTHQRFGDVPMVSPMVIELEKTVVVSSVYGTNAIKGGTLTEDEITAIFQDTPSTDTNTDKKEG